MEHENWKREDWLEFDRKVSEAVIQKNDYYYELLEKGILIEHENNSDRIKLDPDFEFDWYLDEEEK